jgi:Transposase DDE domain group 1
VSAGSDPHRRGKGTRARLGCGRSPAGDRPRHRRHADQRPLREGRSQRNYKGGFGFHPLLCYLAETGEPLAGILRPGNAGSNTAADHFEVLQLALEQLPEADLDREILARADIGGRTRGFTQSCRDAGIRFSVGYEVSGALRKAILAQPESAWRQAIDAEGTEREGADIATLELRHRRRARVEDAIRTGKDTGMRNLPFAAFDHNACWLELSLTAQALLRFAARLCLTGGLCLAEPKRLRQRLLHVAGRLVRSARRATLRLPRSWPWADALVEAFARLRGLPAGAGP